MNTYVTYMQCFSVKDKETQSTIMTYFFLLKIYLYTVLGRVPVTLQPLWATKVYQYIKYLLK